MAGVDSLITKIWVEAITEAAKDGSILAKEMIKDPSKIKDMNGRSQRPSATPSAVRCRHGENLQTFN
ncbi:hypothetical protein QN416_07510, partial [Glaciimonas sp. Cout2]|uniref:hypothetical protein n=1 Tax=Glaciimonas sp. Cout2 TaxID=3048621 RepID=UPI002B23B41A